MSVTLIPDKVPTSPRQPSPAEKAINRIRAEIDDLASHAPPGEEVYLDVLDVGSDFTVMRVREASAEEIAFDGLDARGKAAKAVQHYTRLSYYLRTETPPGKREPIGFVFAEASDPAV